MGLGAFLLHAQIYEKMWKRLQLGTQFPVCGATDFVGIVYQCAFYQKSSGLQLVNGRVFCVFELAKNITLLCTKQKPKSRGFKTFVKTQNRHVSCVAWNGGYVFYGVIKIDFAQHRKKPNGVIAGKLCACGGFGVGILRFQAFEAFFGISEFAGFKIQFAEIQSGGKIDHTVVLQGIA